MGIRVKKHIGFYIDNKDILKILKPNYKDIIDNNESISIEKLKAYRDKKTDKNQLFNINISLLLNITEEIMISDIINIIHFGDEEKGIIFTNSGLKNATRRDDTIDYYENNGMPEYKVQNIRSPIYPDIAYVCIKEPLLTKRSTSYIQECIKNKKEKTKISLGDNLLFNDLILLELEGHDTINNYSYEDRVKNLTYPLSINDKYFHPYIDELIYFVCLELGILKNEISYVDFIQHLEPSIITTWN